MDDFLLDINISNSPAPGIWVMNNLSLVNTYFIQDNHPAFANRTVFILLAMDAFLSLQPLKQSHAALTQHCKGEFMLTIHGGADLFADNSLMLVISTEQNNKINRAQKSTRLTD